MTLSCIILQNEELYCHCACTVHMKLWSDNLQMSFLYIYVETIILLCNIIYSEKVIRLLYKLLSPKSI